MDYRLSLDTFYLGLSIDEFETVEFVKEIKNYLFFLKGVEPSDKFCRNRFYNYELCNDSYGFYCFLYPKKNCKNDMITIQLSGKFFRDIKMSRKFINFIFDRYYSLMEFQRVDVALDVCFCDDELSNVKISDITNTQGFPVPSYSSLWKNRKISFDTYGRICHGKMFLNMIASGKDDYRLRVYDKSLDLCEKYKSNYRGYYGLKDDFPCDLVYRIECQVRSDKLKCFVDNCNLKDDSRIVDYDSLCNSFLYYMLYKYDFEGIDKNYLLGEDFFISNMNIKTESTLDGRLKYNKRMMYSFYKKVVDNYKEKQLEEEDNARLRNIFNKVKNKIIDAYKKNIESVNPYATDYESLLNMDFEKEKTNVPF